MFIQQIVSKERIVSDLAYKTFKNSKVRTKHLRNAIKKLKQSSQSNLHGDQAKRVLVNLDYIKAKLVEQNSKKFHYKIGKLNEIPNLLFLTVGFTERYTRTSFDDDTFRLD
ncbi:hypothetical protein [Providencia rettgeri]|uniref:hypothetical protein n=1 Tax=Providencia rettgeri TaxID=587 RepID=UPI001419DA7A|nr:hypothetical protein [Providencia rettgeri]EMA4781841.1 hypothetical protein [Providencia rettgeri]NIH04000.1 hypothetical protein [Providencia rettgeri]